METSDTLRRHRDRTARFSGYSWSVHAYDQTNDGKGSLSTNLIANAIVRPPSRNFADGQTGSLLGKPNYTLALEQHAAYCRALEECGVSLTHLAADARYPDSTFVEDTAVLTQHGAVITRPGATSRSGETAEIKSVLLDHF